MNANSSLAEPAALRVRPAPFYYGWICVVVAACAMTATLPGRTHGLGLITVPIQTELRLQETTFTWINAVCTILGALFCLPVGLGIDRLGVRRMVAATCALLGLSVLLLTRVESAASLFIALLLIRGIGQGALSVVSMAIVGKWFRRRLGTAMGLYSVLLTLGFVAITLGAGQAVLTYGWRSAWEGLGWGLLAFAGLAWLVTRDSPEACGLEPDEAERAVDAPQLGEEFTVWEALQSPAFWVFSLGTAMFNLVWSALTLLNESLMQERGFDQQQAVQVLAILSGTGLLANFVAGALATRERLGLLMGVGLAVLAGCLVWFPLIESGGALLLYAMNLGVAGGIITVVFFAAWGHLFGRNQLGRVQGVAQVLTILASAAGPHCLAEWREWRGSSHGMFLLLAGFTALAAWAAFTVRVPQRSRTAAPKQ